MGSGHGAHLGVAAAPRAEGEVIGTASNQVVLLRSVEIALRLKDAASVPNGGGCFLSCQADPNARDAYGARPVCIECIETGEGDVVLSALREGRDMLQACCRCALRHFLAGEGHVPVLRLLLLSGRVGDGSMKPRADA